MARPVILSLFDYSGHWPFYFAKNGYEVIQVDLKRGDDVMHFTPPRSVYGVLAAPPCTHFAYSGAQYFPAKDADGRTAEAVKLVNRTLEIIDICRPSFHIIENPKGRITQLLGKPQYQFDPYQFANYAPDPRSNRYTKLTYLWGDFDMPKHMPLPPLYWETATSKRGSFLWYLSGGKSRQTTRSQTPLGFSYATYIANRDPSNLTSFPRITYFL